MRVYGISCTLAIWKTFIKRHEIGILPLQLGSEEYLIFIACKVSKTTSESQQSIFRIAIFLILFLPIISSRLPCPWIFPLKGKERKSINIEYHIDFIAWMQRRIGLLASYRELILHIILLAYLRISSRRLWIPKF